MSDSSDDVSGYFIEDVLGIDDDEEDLEVTLLKSELATAKTVLRYLAKHIGAIGECKKCKKVCYRFEHGDKKVFFNVDGSDHLASCNKSITKEVNKHLDEKQKARQHQHRIVTAEQFKKENRK